MTAWTIWTSLLVAVSGVAIGWISARRQKSWTVRTIVVAIIVLVTFLHERAVTLESEKKFVSTPAGASSFPAILEVLRSAKSEIYIATPFVAYADFTNPSFFREYSRVLREKHEQGVKVLMFVSAPDKRRERLRAEFIGRWKAYQLELAGEEIPEGILRGLVETPQEFARKLGAYCLALNVSAPPRDFESFIALLMQHELAFQNDAKLNFVQSVFSKGEIPFTVWAADDTDAAFTGDGASRVFITHDPYIKEFLVGTAEAAVAASSGLAAGGKGGL